MINRDRRCVHVANEAVSGNLVVNYLESNGIPAELMDGGTNGGFEGVTWLTPGPSYKGIEVWVLNESNIERAKTLLAEKGAELTAAAEARKARTGSIEAQCEECGKSSKFPASQAGRTETCPHCEAFLDVPDPDAPEDDEFWRTTENEPESAQ